MPLFDFIPTDGDDALLFRDIEGTDMADAADGLEFELQMHDEYKVIMQPDGMPCADVFLKGHLMATLAISEKEDNHAA